MHLPSDRLQETNHDRDAISSGPSDNTPFILRDHFFISLRIDINFVDRSLLVSRDREYPVTIYHCFSDSVIQLCRIKRSCGTGCFRNLCGNFVTLTRWYCGLEFIGIYFHCVLFNFCKLFLIRDMKKILL